MKRDLQVSPATQMQDRRRCSGISRFVSILKLDHPLPVHPSCTASTINSLLPCNNNNNKRLFLILNSARLCMSLKNISSPLEEEICQEEANQTQYRNVLNRHALSSLRPDCIRNSGCARLLCGDSNFLALTETLLLDLGRLGDGRSDIGIVADIGFGGCSTTTGGPVLVGGGVVGWWRRLLGL